MRPEVVAAMARASSESTSIVDIQAAASRLIAKVTGAEAGYVTSGASAALTLGTAACLARLDLSKMESLPHSEGIPNEVIIAREHRNGYDHAIRAAGARLIEVGCNEVWAGAGVRAVESWEFEAAITPKTAAIAYFFKPESNPPIEEVIRIGRKHKIPVLVDAAAQLPPVENLRRFTEMGADLVAFSGGKGLRGPQNTGMLVGTRELIASAALQNLDMDEHFQIWDPPESLIPKHLLPGIPRHGIGRGLKVSKEAIIGLLTALNMFTKQACLVESANYARILEKIVDGLHGIHGLSFSIQRPESNQAIPFLNIAINSEQLGRDVISFVRNLRNGEPNVYVGERLLSQGVLIINPFNLDDERASILIDCFRKATIV